MSATKVLVIGIDAASPQLLERWTADGTLPNLAALAARGFVGETRSVDGFYIGATWPSFYTGLTPARHGIHYLAQLMPGTYEFHPSIARPLVSVDPFWTQLSRAGRRVAILDVPLSRLDDRLEGMQVVEWGGHDSVFGFQATPASVVSEIQSRFGQHPLGPSCDGVHRTAEDYATFLGNLLEGVRLKARLTRHFVRQNDWDFFMQVFTEAHCAGHQCWHLHDETHPAYDASVVRVTGDPLRRIYAAIDAAIGEILEEAREARVLVFSAHGMASLFGANFLLSDIMIRLGVAHPRPAPPGPRGARAAMRAGARHAWRRLPPRMKSALQPVRRRVGAQPSTLQQLPSIRVDPRTSRCFAVPNGLPVSGIRLNLIGREPNGLLRPGEEADKFSDELARDLLEIVDERTGRPLILRVRRTADLYAGEHLHRLPDLLIDWSDAMPTGSSCVGNGAAASVRARSPKIGTIEGVNHYGRTGEHRPNGRFIAAGPGWPQGIGVEVSIIDFAPTFTRMFGLDLPRCDGRPIPELLLND
jgi:predicted AlkP superfamily phosphohydrolase/phosphomutase